MSTSAPRPWAGLDRIADTMRRLGDAIPGAAQALARLAECKPLLPLRPRRFGMLTPERAAELLPVGLAVRHYYLDLAGTVTPRADGSVYRRDVSGWCGSVHVQWEDGRAFGVQPRELVMYLDGTPT